MRVKDAVGRFGEQVATDHLQAMGLIVVCRNWRCREGEVDIVARDGPVLVFVEVKTRSSTQFGSPLEAVDRAKIARIRRLAVLWMNDNRDRHPPWSAVRFDVIAVVRRTDGAPADLTHVRAAF